MLNPNLCPRCGGVMELVERYHNEELGLCNTYRCRDCGYEQTVCYKITYSYG